MPLRGCKRSVESKVRSSLKARSKLSSSVLVAGRQLWWQVGSFVGSGRAVPAKYADFRN